MRLKNIWPFVISLILWLLSQGFLLYPRLFYFALILGSLLIIISIRYLAGQDEKKRWPLFTITPLLFFLSFSGYSAILFNYYWIQFIFILVAWFIFAYLRNFYYYSTYQASERREKVDSLLLTGSFLSLFATASVLYGLPVFLSWPFNFLLLIFIPISGLLLVQFLSLRRLKFGPHILFIIIEVIILAELAWVISLLPLNFTILGFILAIIYYFLLIVFRLYLNNDLQGRKLRLPLIFSSLILIILLLTARWL